MKFYCKHPIEAEQFNGSSDLFMKYDMIDIGAMCEERNSPEIYMPGVHRKVSIDDWIITDNFNHHTLMTDKEFQQQYAELPVIPKAVADWIEKCKHDGYGTSVGDMLCYERQPEKVRNWIERTPGTYDCNHRRYKEYQDLVARAWLDGYVVEVDK